MHVVWRTALACVLLCMAAAFAHAAEPAALVRTAEPFTKHNVVLLQSSAVLESRVASIDEMAEYIRAVEAAAKDAVLASASQRPAAGFIVLALRPGPRAKVWLDFDAPAPSFETSRALLAKIGAVKPFEVRNGPVVFALKVGLWDAFESKRLAPAPAEWKAATSKSGQQLEIDALIEQVWRD
jgi:hypothetical protein